ncbi:MAG: VOC family protein [Desulfobacteraceae bacterium]|nr:VOC family protein [Desulfobacteraceae bacterium]
MKPKDPNSACEPVLAGLQRANTILYCHHWRQTVDFYHDVLGLKAHQVREWFVEFQVTDRAFVSVADAGRATIASANGAGLTLSWQVEHLEQIRQALLSKGVEVSPIRSKWGARVCYLKDPEGHRIELWSP